MIFVIMPLGKAARHIWLWTLQVAVYIVASTIGGALAGLLFAGIGQLLGLSGALPLVVLAVLAFAYGLRELGVLSLPMPNHSWQVPNTWLLRNRLGGTFAFGLVLGSGLFTFIEYGSFYVLLGWETALANVALGLLLGGLYGLARGLPVLIGGLSRFMGRDPIKLNMWILNEAGRTLHFLAGLLLLFIAAFLAGGLF